MANPPSLTGNDSAVLSQLFDPEAAPTSAILVDPSLPDEPRFENRQLLAEIKEQEKAVISRVEAALKETERLWEHIIALNEAYDELTELVDANPLCASIRNNRAQLLRLKHGDDLIIAPVDSGNSYSILSLGSTALADLDSAISLLAPSTPQAAVSPGQCRTLAQAHTQRGALFHAASKTLAKKTFAPPVRAPVRALASWTALDFEQAASRDFFMGGRYGNEVAQALAVHTNPTAKLCGQMVQEAMKREYGVAPRMPSP
ncbi:hypothetical protein MMC30_007879 [Trapelia coarctata]|nr:hypothetical protein [Trapelia coarctata]